MAVTVPGFGRLPLTLRTKFRSEKRWPFDSDQPKVRSFCFQFIPNYSGANTAEIEAVAKALKWAAAQLLRPHDWSEIYVVLDSKITHNQILNGDHCSAHREIRTELYCTSRIIQQLYNLAILRFQTPFHSLKLQEIGTYNQRSVELGFDELARNWKRPYANLGDVTETFNGGMSNYNGLQARFEQRSFHGVTMLNAFTWSRVYANVGDSLTSSHGFSGSPQDFYHLDRDYGPAQYDTPILNITTMVWNLPIGRGKLFFKNAGSLMNNIFGGWQISAINQFHSGVALTPNFSPNLNQQLSNSGGVQYRPFFAHDNNDGAITGIPNSSLRKFAIKRLHIPGHPEQAFCDSVYATATQGAYNGCVVGFTNTNPTPATPDLVNDPRGDVPNGLLRADSFDQLDVGLNKTFRLPYKMRFEVRGQFYNVLNKTNFAVPGMTCCSTSFGRITTAYGPGRIAQLQGRLLF